MVSLAPSTPATSRGLAANVTRLLGEIFRAQPRPCILLIAFTIIGNLRMFGYLAAIGGLTQAFIDQDRRSAFLWAGVFILSSWLENLYWPWKGHLHSMLMDHSTLHIQGRVLRSAADVPLVAYEDGDFFARLQRANDDLGGHVSRFTMTLLDFLQVLVSLATILLPLWLIEPRIVLVLAGSSLPLILIQYRTARLLHAARTQTAIPDRRADSVQRVLIDRHAGAELRLFGTGPMLIRAWNTARMEVADAVTAATRRKVLLMLVGEMVLCLGILAVFVLVVKRMLEGDIQLGAWVTIIFGIEWFIAFFSGLARLSRSIREESVFLNDLFEFEHQAATYIATTPERPSATPTVVTALMALELRNVSFGYPSSSRVVVDDVTLSIRSGEHIALVGENGAGKSTLVRLLTGLYTPSNGTVTQDGIDTRDPGAIALRSDIGAVFQDFVRWQLPLRDNVGFGDVHRERSNQEIMDALGKSGLDNLPAEIPGGIEGWLGREFGERDLSGGQWQRIAIARAYFRNARFLVLDEPTAALDPLAEQRLFDRFTELSAGATTLTVSHRLGPARSADRIIVMEHGEITELGPHDELMARNGTYARMFRAQSAWYVNTSPGDDNGETE